MTTYTLYRTATGDISPALVRCSDGSFAGTDPSLTDGDSKAYQAWLAAGNTPGAPEADLLGYASSARYLKETGGIRVGTAQIDTSRESQAMVANAYQFMQVSGATSTQYKTTSGWVTVSADQMKAIALAVGAHVQACFAAEADLDAKITAGAVTTADQVDAAFASVGT